MDDLDTKQYYKGNPFLCLQSNNYFGLNEHINCVNNADELINTNVQVGSDFNPQSTSWQTNTFAAYPTNANTGEPSAWNYYCLLYTSPSPRDS